MNALTPTMETDSERLDQFAGKVMGDIGGAFALLLSFSRSNPYIIAST